MSNQCQNPNVKSEYDLVERTSRFGEEIIDFIKTIPNNPVNQTLIIQLVRSATSVGANYMEADCAESKKDFRHKIGISKKEAKESAHWIRMIARANPDKAPDCRKHWKEAHELTLIFSAILNSRKNQDD